MILNENVDYVMLIHFVVAHRKLTLFTIDSKISDNAPHLLRSIS